MSMAASGSAPHAPSMVRSRMQQVLPFDRDPVPPPEARPHLSPLHSAAPSHLAPPPSAPAAHSAPAHSAPPSHPAPTHSAPVFVRHARARRYVVRVKADGGVRVTIPLRGSRKQAEAFLAEQHEWVARQRQRLTTERAHLAPVHSTDDVKRLRAQARRPLRTPRGRISARIATVPLRRARADRRSYRGRASASACSIRRGRRPARDPVRSPGGS